MTESEKSFPEATPDMVALGFGGDDTSSPSGGSANSSAESASYAGSKSSSTYEYTQQPFETFKLKVAQLCHEIGFGEPAEIQRMCGGSFNRIIGLTFASPEQKHYILRIPRMALDDKRPYEISDQVSVLLYLSQFDFLKVPSIAAYDMTTNNPIASQWVLQTRVPGSSLQDIFYDLPLAEKLQVTSLIADLVIKIEGVKFDKPGRLIGARNLASVCHSPPAALKNIEITGYRRSPVEDHPPVKEQPITSLLIDMFESHKQHELKFEQVSQKEVEMYERLQAMAKEMETAGLMRVKDVQNVLWHWDLSANNILIDRVDKHPAQVDVSPCSALRPSTKNPA